MVTQMSDLRPERDARHPPYSRSPVRGEWHAWKQPQLCQFFTEIAFIWALESRYPTKPIEVFDA
jgi:hypothetical protein